MATILFKIKEFTWILNSPSGRKYVTGEMICYEDKHGAVRLTVCGKHNTKVLFRTNLSKYMLHVFNTEFQELGNIFPLERRKKHAVKKLWLSDEWKRRKKLKRRATREKKLLDLRNGNIGSNSDPVVTR